MIQVTPSGGTSRTRHLNLNRHGYAIGERVLYYRDDDTPAIGEIHANAGVGNSFAIGEDVVLVTKIKARVPAEADAAAALADLAALPAPELGARAYAAWQTKRRSILRRHGIKIPAPVFKS